MSQPNSKTGPLILGLTGSIGMGKSTAARMFADLGVPVFDADAEVHRLQGPGGALLGPIEAAFPGTTGPDGVWRRKLGGLVFGHPAELARLEAIVHPAVHAARGQFLAQHSNAPLVVFDIPLLFEKGLVNEVDRVAVVSVPPHIQRERVMARAGMTEEKFAAIRTAQLPDSEKRARADYVIDSSGPLEQTRKTVVKLVASLRG